MFLQGLEQHGKQWKVIAGMIGTRTVVQVRTHAQKYFQKMERDGSNTSMSFSAASKHLAEAASFTITAKTTKSNKLGKKCSPHKKHAPTNKKGSPRKLRITLNNKISKVQAAFPVDAPAVADDSVPNVYFEL
jgi:hypothetical protein